ncbi:MAG: RagB/SusD family nutrient uptake outer membrane protein, partial [Muribaculaceae bacterium]|nr:RagB/SusD family nutrient uptake outer membrane protein [Muribaculaceae bacterium]
INNDRLAIGGSSPVNEIIWTIPQAKPQLLSYANGTFMVNAWLGTSTDDTKWKCDPLAQYNTRNSGWKCVVARREFVEKFDWDATYSTSPDIRTKLWLTAADGFGIDNVSLTQADYGNNGFLAVKFTNWAIDDNGNIDYNASPEATDQLGIDYPMIRLAEIYLSAAEAYLNTGNEPKAVEYTNYIRERAGMPPFTQLTPQLLRDERCRELYTESTRRTDLIRYNQWISGYTWAWKNNRQQGADFASNFNLFPIPSSVVSRNGYTQNPGY